MLDGREALSDVEDGMMADDLAELLDSSGLGLLKLRAANPDTVAAKLEAGVITRFARLGLILRYGRFGVRVGGAIYAARTR